MVAASGSREALRPAVAGLLLLVAILERIAFNLSLIAIESRPYADHRRRGLHPVREGPAALVASVTVVFLLLWSDVSWPRRSRRGATSDLGAAIGEAPWELWERC